METRRIPFGVVVKDHQKKLTLNNADEIRSYLLREKTKEEVDRIMIIVNSHAYTIKLPGREGLMTELR